MCRSQVFRKVFSMCFIFVVFALAFAACGGDAKEKDVFVYLADTTIKIIKGDGVTQEQFDAAVEAANAGWRGFGNRPALAQILQEKLDEIHILTQGSYYKEIKGKRCLGAAFDKNATYFYETLDDIMGGYLQLQTKAIQ
jgi:hypothetical protein